MVEEDEVEKKKEIESLGKKVFLISSSIFQTKKCPPRGPVPRLCGAIRHRAGPATSELSGRDRGCDR